MSETNKARERLRACLKYEENRFSRIGTHGVGCWQWGPSHYECALRESERKDAALREAREVILHFANARGSQFEGSEAEAVGFIDAALSASPTPAKSGETRADGEPVEIGYVNWRGEYSRRHILPTGIFWSSTKFHPQPQWLIEAMDVDRGAMRTFALADIGAKPPAEEPRNG